MIRSVPHRHAHLPPLPTPKRAARRLTVAGATALLLFCLGAATLLLDSGRAQAAPLLAGFSDALYVTPDGLTSGACKRSLTPAVEDPPTAAFFNYSAACELRYALSIAVDGDTLRLAGGNYVTTDPLLGAVEISKSVTLIGGHRADFGDATGSTENEPEVDPVANPTLIVAQIPGPTLAVVGPVTTTLTTNVLLDGLRILHAVPDANRGPGISVTLPLSPTGEGLPVILNVVNSVVGDNSADEPGGGIAIHPQLQARIGVTGTVFTANRAPEGGALALPPTALLAGSGATFVNNQATIGAGGAIHAHAAASISLPGVNLSFNQAAGAGGALYALGTPVTLAGSVTNNSAGGAGGGLYLDGDGATPIAAMSALTLTANSAGLDGGGIFARDMALTLAAGTVTDNSAGGAGGGLHLNAGTATLGPFPILRNQADIHGGGIYRADGDLTLTGNLVMTNTALGGSGGGIATVGTGNSTLTGLTWRNNQAGGAGGAAYLTAQSANVSASPLMVNNRAGFGGALFIQVDGAATVSSNSDVRANSAPGGVGGAFVVAAQTATIANNTLLTNTAALGGALFVSGTVTTNLTGNTVQDNLATGSGGGIYLFNSPSVNTSNLTLMHNRAQVDGGALVVDGSGLTASGLLNLTENYAQGRGGGAYLAPGANVTLGSLTLLDNAAGLHGGGLFATGARLTVLGAASAITNSTNTGSGGALMLTNGSAMTVTGALTLEDNQAQLHGGGLYAEQSRLVLSSGGTVRLNRALTGDGGGMQLANNVSAVVGPILYTFNRAGRDGGAVGGANVDLVFNGLTQVISNTANSSGGGFHLINGVAAGFNRALIRENFAITDGGGFLAKGLTVNMGAESEVADNIAHTGDGGGLYVTDGTLLMGRSDILRNTARNSGGGIYAADNEITLAPLSRVALNRALTFHGGGIYAAGGGLALVNVRLEQNHARVDGGGLYLTGGEQPTSLLLADGSRVVDNHAETGFGGGLRTGAGEVTLRAAAITQNTAREDGGGLYQASGTLVVTAAMGISANVAISGAGGGLAILTGTVTVHNSLLRGNVAEKDGGGFYAPGSRVALTGGTLVNGNTSRLGRGGGGYADGLRFEARNVTITGNRAELGGGGFWAATLYAALDQTTLSSNNGGKGPGGGAYFSADLAEIFDNSITNNETAGNGGALAMAEVRGSSLLRNIITGNRVRRDVTSSTVTLQEDVVIQQTGQVIARAGDVVTGESVTEGTGGGLHLVNAHVVMVENTIRNNVNLAGEGGGIYANGGGFTMTNNLVVQNRTAISTVYGSGIYLINGLANIRHTTIADNRNTSSDPSAMAVGIYVTKGATETSALNMVNSIVAGHQQGMLLLTGNTSELRHNVFFNTEGDWDGPGLYEPSVGNVVGDPLFVNRDAGNYAIQRRSAAFDMGLDIGVERDFIGTVRPRAFGIDAGAYEHFYPQGVHMTTSASPMFVNNNETIDYRIRIINHSLVPLTDVSLSVTLPSQQTANSISGPGCAGTSCNLGTLAVGQLVEVTLRTTAGGTPPPQGFIEMATVVNVSSSSFGLSDRQEQIITRLQRCRIVYAGVDYPTIQAAVNAVNDFDDIPDTVRVSGYCGGTINVQKKMTIQGGWNSSMTVLDPVQFPTTVDAGGTGRILVIRGANPPVIENLILRGGNARGLGGGPSGKDGGGVVYIEQARAILRNVRVVGGNAAYGGGVYVARLTAPIFENSIIENSRASESGGGLYADNSSPILNNVIVRNNNAKAGGGVYLSQSDAQINGSTIQGNTATGTARFLEVAGFNLTLGRGGGGGVYLDESKGGITNSTLRNNSAKAGGAIFADNSPSSVAGSLLEGNRATADSTVIPIIVLANTAGGGGAIYAQRSDMVIEYNRIVSNTSVGPGGGIHIFNGSADAKINGNFIGYNEAGRGAAAYVQLKPDTFKIFVLPVTIPDFLMPYLLGQPQPDPPKLVFMQNTIAHNKGGSAVLLFGETYGQMVGNLFAFNTGTGVVAQTAPLPYIALIPVPIIFAIPIPFPVFYVPVADMEYTLWHQNGGRTSSQGIGARVSTSNDITNKDPAFKNDGFSIKRISGAYDAGRNTGVPVDLLSTARPQGDLTDLGAVEYPFIGVRYVAPGGGDSGANLCRDYLNPCGSLQVAIDSARDGDLIKMAGGTYTGQEERLGQRQMGFITKTVTIQGGYYRFTYDNNVTEGRYTDHDWEVPFPDLNPTILDAGNDGRVFYILDQKLLDDDGNPIEVKPVLSGLVLRNGNAAGLAGPQANLFSGGGAVYVDNVEVTLRNIDIFDSRADYGGALYLINGVVRGEDVVIRNNQANHRGGGVYVDRSDDVVLRDFVIENNRAPRGGGVYVDTSRARLQGNLLNGNGDAAATVEGGALFLQDSDATVISNTVTANTARNGGGIVVRGGAPQITGNILRSNRALDGTSGNGRGGACFLGEGSPLLRGNTIQSNQAIDGGGCYLLNSQALLELNNLMTNTAGRAGGGIYLADSSQAVVRENSVTDNVANGTGENDGGGGIYFEASNTAVENNVLTGNRATAGGGAYLFSFSNATVRANEMRNNTATRDGGGVYLKLSNAVLQENIIVENRTTQGSGGGVYVKLSGARLTKNQVDGNSATVAGGGVYLDESGAALVEDSVQGNQARDGGGVYLFRSNTARFDTVTIRGNRADRFGGGLFLSLSNIPLEDHTIQENQAGVAGGGAYLEESSVSFNRNLVRNNQAGEQGGGVAITRNSQADLASNALLENRAGVTGSGIYVSGSSPTLVHTTFNRNQGGDGTGLSVAAQAGTPAVVSLVNTIFANHTLAVRASNNATVTLLATLWDGNGTNFTPGGGVVDPGPTDFNFTGPARFQPDGYHLQRNSVASGVGVTTNVGRDIDGDGRPQGSGPDLGADELPAECAAVATSDLEQVYSSVQAAVDAAQPGDEVRISGTCTGAPARGALRQTAYIDKQITVRGGYTPTNWLESFPITQPTFLDAQGMGRVIFIAPGFNPLIENLNLTGGLAAGLGGGPNGGDAGGILYARNATPTLRNLTFQGGEAELGGALYLQNSNTPVTDSSFSGSKALKGGAVFLRNSNAVFIGNEFLDNQSEDGGAFFVSFSQPQITDNLIARNAAQAAGGALFLESSTAGIRTNRILTNTAQAAGGIYVDGAAPDIVRNLFSANSAQNAGGLYLSGSPARVDGNRFIANSAAIGGGLYIQGEQPILDNNVIAKNSSQVQAAAVYILAGSPRLRHNTLAANLGGDGVAVWITDLGVTPSNVKMVNNIVVDHTAGITLTAGNRLTVRNSLWFNNGQDVGGSGIVSDLGGHVRVAPNFVNPIDNDYHLLNNSPARDAGATDAGVAFDFDGQNRPADAGFDIGADEFVFLDIRVIVQTIPDPVIAGLPFNVQIRVINSGNVDQVANITMTLPPGMIPSGLLDWSALVRQGESWVQSFTAQVDPGFAGVLVAPLAVVTDGGLTQQVDLRINVTRPASGLEIIAEASPSPVPAGSELTYQIRVNNVGNLVLTPTVTADLPDLISVADVLSWDPGALAPGSSWNRTLRTTVSADATGALVAVFRAQTPTGQAAVVTKTVPVAQPALFTTITAQPDPPRAGQLLTYTVVVTNVGNVDFTTNITVTAPIAANGRPLVSPGVDQVFSNVELAAGGVWTRTVTFLVEADYVGPLTTRVNVATNTGLRTSSEDTRQVSDPSATPTIRAVRSGPWDDPNTWDPARVPNAGDIVLIPAGIVLTVDGGRLNPIQLTGLINDGTIRLNCVVGEPMRIEASDFIRNNGLIVGADGQSPGEPGCAVEVATNTLTNPGTIRAGNGADGAIVPPANTVIDGGDGGAMRVFAQTIVNDGEIRAGNGGALAPPAITGQGGDGGDVLVVAGPPDPALLLNRGLIAGGDGGGGPGGDQGDGRGGDGGNATLLSSGQFTNDGGSVAAGSGGDGNGDGIGGGQPGAHPDDGTGGSVSRASPFFWDNGVGGVYDQEFGFATVAEQIVRGFAGATVNIPIAIINRGLRSDTYILLWSNSLAWPQSGLPDTFRVPGMRYRFVDAAVQIPPDARVGDRSELRVSITSQSNPSLTREETVTVLVVSSTRILLPNVVRSEAVRTQIEEPQTPTDTQAPPTDLLYLPNLGHGLRE